MSTKIYRANKVQKGESSTFHFKPEAGESQEENLTLPLWTQEAGMGMGNQKLPMP